MTLGFRVGSTSIDPQGWCTPDSGKRCNVVHRLRRRRALAASAWKKADGVPPTSDRPYTTERRNSLCRRNLHAQRRLPLSRWSIAGASSCHRTAAPAPQKGPGLGRGTLVTSVPFALGPITRPGATAVLPPQSSRREGV